MNNILNKFKAKITKPSFKIAFVYFILGCLWTVLTSKIISWLPKDNPIFFVIGILVAYFFVLITAVVLYIHSDKQIKKIEKVKDELNEKNCLISSILESSPEVKFFTVDKDYNYIAFNNNHRDTMFEIWEKEIQIGQNIFNIINIDENKLNLKLKFDRSLAGESFSLEEEYGDSELSKTYWKHYHSPLISESGDIIGANCFVMNITAQKTAEKKLYKLTYTDSLTGLCNRTCFIESTARLDKQDYLPLSVIAGDVNGLKLINDTFGHVEGDKLLIEVSEILCKCVRFHDVLGRIGGDEFCILLPNTTKAEARDVLFRIEEAVAQFNEARNDKEYYISIALGCETKETIEESIEKVYKVAEELMYECKVLEQKSQRNSILSSIMSTLFEKTYEAESHATRLMEYSKEIGQALGLSEKELVNLNLLSELHDIGKISIDSSILTKPGTLTEEEWKEIRKHPETGYRIAQSVPEFNQIAECILHHHERWDGNGYPSGLSGDNIPILSRILSIVDAFDAMTQDRAYRKAMSVESALDEIRNNAGTQFDPDISKLFIELIKNK